MQTYYISVAGNDSAAGGESTPWRTLASIKRAAAGSTIRVAPGTYAEALTVSTQGLIIEALDPAQPPVIDGEFKQPTGKIQKAGLALPGGQTTLGFTYGGLVSIAANDITLRNLAITRALGRSVLVNKAKNVDMAGLTITNGRTFGVLVIDSENVDLIDTAVTGQQNNATVWRPRDTLAYGKAVMLERVKGCKVERCRVHGNYGQGIGTLTAVDTQVNDNIVFDFWREGINISGGTRVKALRNHVYDSGAAAWKGRAFFGVGYFPETGVGASSAGPNVDCEIAYNLVVDIDGAANISADPGVDSRNCTMHHNTFVVRRAGESLIKFNGAAPGFAFTDNVLVGAGNPGTVSAAFLAGKSTFARNVWHGVQPTTDMRGDGDIYADPMLVDMDGDAADVGNFKLRSKSPAAGRGAFAVADEPVDPPVDPPTDPVPPTRDELLLAWFDRGEKWLARGREIMAMGG